MKKIAVIAISVLFICIIISFGAILFVIKGKLPDIDGEIYIDGLKAPITILTDKWGIPHIKAEQKEDLFFGLGYVHARDRLFQMEFLKRIALGRLSEITGEPGLRYDRFFRTLQLKRLAEDIRNGLGPEEKQLGRHYIDGINSYIGGRKNKYPIEFALMGFEPEEWSEIDLLTYAHLLMWRMSYNYKAEMLYHQIQKKVGHKAAMELLPYRPDGVPSLAYTLSDKPVRDSRNTEFMDILEILGPSAGSNNWVLSGEKTISGKPIFVEDPHDHGTPIPSSFYIVHLVCPGWDIIGMSSPGLPFFQHAYNKYIAYGSTTMGSDSQDLFIERINPENPMEYLFRGNWLKMKTHVETIRIKDRNHPGGYRDEGLTVRSTRHGPILTDIVFKGDETLSLKWFAFDPQVIKSIKRMSEAKNCTEFLDAGKDYLSGSAQNFVCADMNGNIAYSCLGWIPVRGHGMVSWFPKPGWTGEHEWQGGISGAGLPRLFNPAKGYLATANNQVVGKGSHLKLDGSYASHYRYSRIVELIESQDKFSLDDARRILIDKKSLLAQRLGPVLKDVLKKSDHPKAPEALSYLEEWDYQMTPNSIAATLYHQTILEFLILTLSDQLGEKLAYKYLRQWYLALDRWVSFLENNEGKWFDSIATRERESKADMLNIGFQQAIRKLERLLGEKMSNWQWGKIHKLEFRHRPMDREGWLMKKIFNRGQYVYGGDTETINRSSYSIKRPFEVNAASSFRFAIDFSQPEKAFLVQSTGQAEHLLSPYRDNHVKTFLNGELIAVDLDLEKVEKEADGKFVLKPMAP